MFHMNLLWKPLMKHLINYAHLWIKPVFNNLSFTVLHIFCFVVWSSIIMEHVSLYEDDPYICFVKSFWKYTCINLYHTSCLINGYLKLVYLLIIHFILYSLLPKNCNNASYLLPIRIIIINVLTSFMIYTISADKTICNECIYMNDYILYG